MGGFFLMSLMPLLFAIGFAYIIWVLASKEGVALKTVGQVIAVAIVVIALLSSAFVGGRGYRGKAGFGQGRQMRMMEKKFDRGINKSPNSKMGEKLNNPASEAPLPADR